MLFYNLSLSQSKLAKLLGVSRQSVNDWALGRKKIPIQQAVEIERFSGGAVLREEMRPDDWMDIWPELVKMNRLERRSRHFSDRENKPFIDRRNGCDRRRIGGEGSAVRRNAERKISTNKAVYRSDSCVND